MSAKHFHYLEYLQRLRMMRLRLRLPERLRADWRRLSSRQPAFRINRSADCSVDPGTNPSTGPRTNPSVSSRASS